MSAISIIPVQFSFFTSVCHFFTVIPYHFTVSTGADRDASTTSRAYVIIMGPNNLETDRLWLDLPEGKKCFGAESMENFENYGLDVGEIKRVEVRLTY